MAGNEHSVRVHVGKTAQVLGKGSWLTAQGVTREELLGYIGEISAGQLKEPQFKGYTQGDTVGQSGAEATYERWLQGHKGKEKFKVNSTGKNLGPRAKPKKPRGRTRRRSS